MHALVTGAAGFIGSHLVDRLLADGATVTGVDLFTDYYDVDHKRRNVAGAVASDRFSLVETDLRAADLRPLLDGVDVVFHQAGQPGVRSSWAEGFADYVGQNVLATQRLLEAAKGTSLQRFVYASSSSIYGTAARYPTVETDLPTPTSPYGVTKLAGEHLAVLYARNHGVPTTALRYFTVYGPRQRPDMAIYRLIEAARHGHPFPLFGDGGHVRDFTFVADVVEANLAAARSDAPTGLVVNVAGGDSTTMSGLVEVVERAVGRPVHLDRLAEQPGDVRRTGGDVSAATAALGLGADDLPRRRRRRAGRVARRVARAGGEHRRARALDPRHRREQADERGVRRSGRLRRDPPPGRAVGRPGRQPGRREPQLALDGRGLEIGAVGARSG
jgi:nucleoside-diphosphate-sugar epimerase